MTKEEFITKSEQIYGKNRFDYSKVPETFYKTQTIELTCLIHNETFFQTPKSHLAGTLKCYKCIDEQEYRKIQEKYKDFVIDEYHEELKQHFLERAYELCGDLYDFTDILYINTTVNIRVLCKKHNHYFWIEPSNLLTRKGIDCCPICREEKQEQKRLELRKIAQEKFIQKSKEIFGEDAFDYSKVNYEYGWKEVELICNKHKTSFWKTPINHLSLKQGCPLCQLEKNHSGFLLTFNEFVAKAIEKFGENRFIFFEDEYVNAQTKTKIYCIKHKYTFYTTPSDFLKAKYGCPYCTKDAVGFISGRALTQEEFIARSKKLFGDDTFDYSNCKYVNMDTPVELFCNIHKISFKVIPEKHLCRGTGCPICSKSESYLERIIRVELERNNIFYTKQKTFPWLINKCNLKLDFYLDEYNIAIECQGAQHFKVVESAKLFIKNETDLKKGQNRDKLKHDLCEEHNIPILYFAKKKYVDNYELGEVYTTTQQIIEKIL